MVIDKRDLLDMVRGNQQTDKDELLEMVEDIHDEKIRGILKRSLASEVIYKKPRVVSLQDHVIASLSAEYGVPFMLLNCSTLDTEKCPSVKGIEGEACVYGEPDIICKFVALNTGYIEDDYYRTIAYLDSLKSIVRYQTNHNYPTEFEVIALADISAMGARFTDFDDYYDNHVEGIEIIVDASYKNSPELTLEYIDKWIDCLKFVNFKWFLRFRDLDTRETIFSQYSLDTYSGKESVKKTLDFTYGFSDKLPVFDPKFDGWLK